MVVHSHLVQKVLNTLLILTLLLSWKPTTASSSIQNNTKLYLNKKLARSPEQISTQWATYTSLEFGYSADHPLQWSPIERRSAVSPGYNVPSDVWFGDSIHVITRILPFTDADIAETWRSAEQIETTRGLKGRKLEYTVGSLTEYHENSSIHVLFRGDGADYLFIYSPSSELVNITEEEKRFESMVDSFQILPQRAYRPNEFRIAYSDIADQFDFPVDPTDGSFDGPPSYAGYNVNNSGLNWVSPCYQVSMQNVQHAGEDWFRPSGSPVYAVANGLIVYSNPKANYPGAVVIIKHTLPSDSQTPWHTNAIYSVYGHLTDDVIAQGADVKKGDRIGKVNPYPNNSPHIHFELRRFLDMKDAPREVNGYTLCPHKSPISTVGPGYTDVGTNPDWWGYTNPSDWIENHRELLPPDDNNPTVNVGTLYFNNWSPRWYWYVSTFDKHVEDRLVLVGSQILTLSSGCSSERITGFWVGWGQHQVRFRYEVSSDGGIPIVEVKPWALLRPACAAEMDDVPPIEPPGEPPPSNPPSGGGMTSPECDKNAQGIILYSEQNYGGRCTHITTDHPNLGQTNVGDDAVSSIRVNGDFQVRLYEHLNYGGRYVEVSNSNLNLDVTSLGEQFSSVKISSQEGCKDKDASGVLLYADKNYEGNCVRLTSSVANLGSTAVSDNEASSIRINGEYSVKLYKDINFGGGNPEEVNKSDPDLDKRSLGGQYSSVRIESPVRCDNENLPGVYLYSEKRQKGSCAYITADVANLGDTAVRDNDARSLRIVGPYYVKMYKDRDFKGPSDEFHTNQDDLTWRSLGDQYSSVRFFEENKPPVLAFGSANAVSITSNNQDVWSNLADWSFSGTASDSDGSVSRVEFNCDGDTCYERNRQVNGTSSWSYSRTGLTGYNRIYFFAYDNKNARSSERDRSAINLYVDQAPPATTASLNSESNRERWPDWFTQPVQVRLDAQDGATGRARRGVAEVAYRVDGGGWQTVAGSSAAFALNSDGPHQVDFYAVDGVGNREATQSITFHIDQTPPSPPSGVTESHGAPHNSWQRDVDTPAFTWNPSADATSGVWGYQFYFDTDPAGIGYQTFLADDSRTWTPRPDGVRTATYYLRGRSRDVAGNWSGWTDLFTFRYDGTPPENPDSAIHAGGVENDTWQRTTNLADFTWPEAHDEGSGISGYHTYWGIDPAGTADAFTAARSFQSSTPLCAVDSACSGYLRLRSVDNVQNQAEDWSTVFALRYDNAQPSVDFTFNGGMTQTAQTQVALDINASDLGSGVKEMRFSSDGQNWSAWEVHRTSRAWTIPGISRKDWPVYAQVRDGVGLESPVVMHRIYLDVNPQRPRSDNFRLFAYFSGAGAEAQTSTPSNFQLQSTVGQASDTKPIGSTNFTLLGGYQAGSRAIPLLEPGHDEFNFINGLFASGVYSDTLHSANFQMIGSLGEVGLPNNKPGVSSDNFQIRPGFLAAEPVVKPLPATTPEAGPTPEPEAAPGCDFPQVSIDDGALFTNQPQVLLSLCAPRAVEMKISNEGSFATASWEAYSVRKDWTLPVDGKTVTPRFVYVLFKDGNGTVHGTYIDDIIYDPNPPSGNLAAGDSVSGAVAMRALRSRSADVAKQRFFQVGSTVYMQQVSGRSLSQPIALLRTGADGSVDLFVDAQDDNSGLAQMQFGADGATLDSALWESYSALKPWIPSPEDGIQTVYARVKDDAGNASTTAQVSFVVDTQPPVGGIAVARQVIGPDETSLTIYLGAEDNLTGVAEMRLSQSSDFADAAWVPYTTLWAWGLDLTANPTGGTVYVQYRDLAGNVSEVYSDNFIVDAVAPLLYAEVDAGESLTRSLQLHAYDELAGVGSVSISNDPQMLTGTVTLAYTDILTWTFDESQVAWVQVEDRVGNVTAPYPAYAAIPYDYQSVPVGAGWNLNSFAVEPTDLSTPSVLQSIAGSYAWIQGDGLFFDPSLGPEYNTLGELRPEAAYYVYTTQEEEVALVGTRIPVTTPIPLQAKWNWIGYLPDTALPVEQALGSIAGKYQRIVSITDTYESVLPDNSYLTVLEPGQGYLIYMNEPAILIYPDANSIRAVEPRQTTPMTGCDVSPTPLLTLVYGGVSVNGRPAPVGTKIEALSTTGEIAGCFVVQKSGDFGLMHVYGGWDPTLADHLGLQEGDAVSWRVNGVLAQSDPPLQWQSDLVPHQLSLDTVIVTPPIYLPLIGGPSETTPETNVIEGDSDVFLPFTNR